MAATDPSGHPELATHSVALVGFMGAGKSSVGRELARLLGREFVDTDSDIVATSGRTIAELFAAGEPEFRAVERRCVLAAVDLPPCVIALGGGAFTQPELADGLLRRTLVVHLELSWDQLVPLLPRLGATRPLIGSRSEAAVERLFRSRAVAYRRAHLCVPARQETATATAIAVATALRAHHAPRTDVEDGSGHDPD